MVDDKDKQDPGGAPKTPEKISGDAERPVRVEQEAEKIPERKEISEDDKRVSAELRKELEMMELDDATKGEVEKKREKIEFLGEKEKIEHLLQMAREKGVVFAIQVARSMNEPYILDILHDILAQEGYYQKFTKPADDDTDDDKKK